MALSNVGAIYHKKAAKAMTNPIENYIVQWFFIRNFVTIYQQNGTLNAERAFNKQQ
jgi:hypothetical protein